MIGEGEGSYYHYHRQPLLQQIRWDGPKLNNNGSQPIHLEAGASFQRHLPENHSFRYYDNSNGHAQAVSSFTTSREEHPEYVHYNKINDENNCRINPIDNGPFVFGIHSPSQFKLDTNYSNEDYVDPSIETSPMNALYADKKIVVKPVENRSFRRKMFRIEDNRAEKSIKNKFSKKREKKITNNETKDKIKCVLVGDGAVGKTSLITSYAQNKFSCDYRPTAFDNYNVRVEVDDRPIAVEICDTAGQDSMQGLRELCYPGADVIMICFSVVQPRSFKSISTRWAPRITPINAPLILVGTQSDLRDDYNALQEMMLRGESPVSEMQGRELAASLNAIYIETSSKTRWKLKEAFDSAILAALPIRKKKKSLFERIFCFS